MNIQVYGAVTMNNTMCLGLFLMVVGHRSLAWTFSSETVPTPGEALRETKASTDSRILCMPGRPLQGRCRLVVAGSGRALSPSCLRNLLNHRRRLDLH